MMWVILGLDFRNGVVRKIGDGMKMRFWKEKWGGNSTLWDAFPRLFSLSNKKISIGRGSLGVEGCD